MTTVTTDLTRRIERSLECAKYSIEDAAPECRVLTPFQMAWFASYLHIEYDRIVENGMPSHGAIIAGVEVGGDIFNVEYDRDPTTAVVDCFVTKGDDTVWMWST